MKVTLNVAASLIKCSNAAPLQDGGMGVETRVLRKDLPS
jgi:hypothetical protein